MLLLFIYLFIVYLFYFFFLPRQNFTSKGRRHRHRLVSHWFGNFFKSGNVRRLRILGGGRVGVGGRRGLEHERNLIDDKVRFKISTVKCLYEIYKMGPKLKSNLKLKGEEKTGKFRSK